MFSWIIGSSLKFRLLVVAVAATLLVFGTQQLRKMPVDVFPEFAPPKVEIQTEGPGMTANEVEELITIPMEDAMRGVPGVRSASITVTRLSMISRETIKCRLVSMSGVANFLPSRERTESLRVRL